MKITFGPDERGHVLMLHNRTRHEARRAIEVGRVFGFHVIVQVDGDDFSRLCTALDHTMQDLRDSMDDIAAFHAPRECINLVVWDTQRLMRRLLGDFGFTPESFLAELVQRTSHKFAYEWSGVGLVWEVDA